MMNYLDYVQINDSDSLCDFIDQNPDFHVVLDNDCFVIYPCAPDDWTSDEEWDAWHDCGQSVDMNPDQFLMILIEYLGGSVERC